MLKLLTLAATLYPLTLMAGDPPQNLPRDPESVFKRLDLNSDGKLTREEFTKLRDNFSEKAKAVARRGELTAKVFAVMDENKDTAVTFEEFKKFRDKTAARLKKRKGDAT